MKKTKSTWSSIVFSMLLIASLGVVSSGGVAFAQTNTTGTTTATTTDNTTGTTTSNTTGTTTMNHIMVMKHLCNYNVKSVTDFENLEVNRDPISALANTVLNCPTTGLVGDNAVADTVSSPRMNYEFKITGENGTASSTMSQDGMFMPGKLCESDINKDVDGNGSVASSTCLDISHYDMHINASSSLITVAETINPTGYHFGALRFTPNSLSSNNDSATLVGASTTGGIINLDMATDTDKMVMLHIYNFLDATSTGTTTPPVIQPTNQAIMEVIKSIQATLVMLQTQLQTLINQLTTNGNNNGNNGGNNGGNVFTNASAHVASPTTVIGDTNDFAGDHFQPYEKVSMIFDGNVVMTLDSDKEGNWHTPSVRMPIIPGQKTYTFKGLSSGAEVNVNVQVTQIP